MRLRQSFWAAIIVLTALAAPLAAHHSFAAEYDSNKPIKFSGKVTKVEWLNPHIYVYVDAKDDGGAEFNPRASSGTDVTFIVEK